MPPTYILEEAKSSRSSCKVCKEKITKGELRIGSVAQGPGDYEMTSWRHAICFKVPKKFNNDLESLFEGGTAPPELLVLFERVLSAKADVLGQKKREIEEVLTAANEAMEGTSSPSRKKVKTEGTSPTRLAAIEEIAASKGLDGKLVALSEKYSHMTTAAMKQILKFNYQVQSGNKDELKERCIQGERFGGFPRCEECKGGEDVPGRTTEGRKSSTLKLQQITEEHVKTGQGIWTCSGYYDTQRVACYFKSTEPIERVFPWITTAEAFEAKEEETLALVAARDEKGLEDVEFDTDGMDRKTIVSKLMDVAKKLGIALPPIERDARVQIATVYMEKDQSIKATMMALRKTMGTNEEEAKKREKLLNSCGHPANTKLMMYFKLAAVAKKSDHFKAISYRKTSIAIQKLTFPIDGTEGRTGKAISTSKKFKVDGIGKSGGIKIDEYLSTGKIEVFDTLFEEQGLSLESDDNTTEGGGSAPSVKSESSAAASFGYNGYEAYGGGGGYGGGY